jgi:glycerol-3-phosphate dehydrogenase (NAD(P)+)
MGGNRNHERLGPDPEPAGGEARRQTGSNSRPDRGTNVRIAVIGAGSWGTTVASMLAERFDTMVWALEPEVAEEISVRHENPTYLADFTLTRSLRATTDQNEAVEDRQLLVMAVPAQHMRGVAEQLALLVGPDVVTLSLTKGIELGTLRRPTEILAEAFGPRHRGRIGVLAGPNLAREVMAGQPSATVVAIPDADIARWLQSLLNSAHFRVYTSDDVLGCEIGGAVKNVIAIASGVADGLGYGWNTRAALSPESRNHRVGVALGQSRNLGDILAETNMVPEGVDSTPAVLALAGEAGVEMPVVEQVGAMLAGERSPEAAVASLMGRRLTSELHDLGSARHHELSGDLP